MTESIKPTTVRYIEQGMLRPNVSELRLALSNPVKWKYQNDKRLTNQQLIRMGGLVSMDPGSKAGMTRAVDSILRKQVIFR